MSKPPTKQPSGGPVEVDPCIGTALEDGIVHVDGPNGMTVEMTAKAALETARSLSDAAIDALVAKDQPAEPDSKKRA